jgi:hypothetical protein
MRGPKAGTGIRSSNASTLIGRAHADLRAKYEIARDLSDPREAA